MNHFKTFLFLLRKKTLGCSDLSVAGFADNLSKLKPRHLRLFFIESCDRKFLIKIYSIFQPFYFNITRTKIRCQNGFVRISAKKVWGGNWSDLDWREFQSISFSFTSVIKHVRYFLIIQKSNIFIDLGTGIVLSWPNWPIKPKFQRPHVPVPSESGTVSSSKRTFCRQDIVCWEQMWSTFWNREHSWNYIQKIIVPNYELGLVNYHSSIKLFSPSLFADSVGIKLVSPQAAQLRKLIMKIYSNASRWGA